METDQFNLPHVPLADIGDEVSEYVENNLRMAIAKINAEIVRHQSCVDVTRGKASECSSPEKEREKLAFLRSNDAVARELYELSGDGNIFVSKFGTWINSHDFRASPSRYKTNYLHSIYLAAPIDYVTLSPTVKVFGVEFGTDKLDHFFQQGYKYYRIYNKASAKGASTEHAATKAIKWGQKTERTYFGLLVSGVYSNADLYANFAGMKFYQGLTKSIEIGSGPRTAAVVLRDGIWTVNDESLRNTLLKPFITDHLNEALNLSGYAFTIFGSVRRAVKKYGCPDWQRAFPHLTAETFAERSEILESWNGEDYGHTNRGRRVSIAETCYEIR